MILVPCRAVVGVDPNQAGASTWAGGSRSTRCSTSSSVSSINHGRDPRAHIDEARLHELLADNPLVGIVNLLAGGEVLSHFSLAAAGFLPYLMALGRSHPAVRLRA